ncbi:Phosphatidylethanolamine-binding protein [Aspergillus sclerotialis]|uniref:Phosphatidylethanolamine-binding protein n=1 Tax=Aspergillus sclerotialis TaxID=2070753 RepID=A0A3A2ZMM4_9EURO|nr:Phosphatidylethanolamine-binding protein [Aspergillus sclerotialis]
MTLESIECGESGSSLLSHHTCLDEDSEGKFPELRWTAPPTGEVKEYALICEDLDLPIPYLVIHHGFFFNIPPSTTTACHTDIVHQEANVNAHVTNSGWVYIPNLKGTSYIGAAPPLGHGPHRYVFTIIALDSPLNLSSHDKVTKEQMKDAMIGKVMGWGQWTGVFERPWTEYA